MTSDLERGLRAVDTSTAETVVDVFIGEKDGMLIDQEEADQLLTDRALIEDFMGFRTLVYLVAERLAPDLATMVEEGKAEMPDDSEDERAAKIVAGAIIETIIYYAKVESTRAAIEG